MNKISVFDKSPFISELDAIMEWTEKKEKEQQDHVHYGCAWELRKGKVFHVCHELKKEWEVK